jgi:hypothetical protein
LKICLFTVSAGASRGNHSSKLCLAAE